ncbi:MAG TPA: hypothetical protein VK968_00505, partial [Roseimicrobium sp.]|nr:hypothetical protein [Roseimicrobium sp.]
MNSGAPDILTLRRWLIVATGLLLAVFTGYLLADPFRYTSLGFVAALTGLLLSPVFIQHYHPLLIYAWNLSLVIPFFPGKPSVGWVLSGIGFGIALLNRTLNHSKTFITDRWLTRAILLVVAVLATNAQMNGGLGVSALGSDSVGGKKYALLFAAIMGFVALTSVPIPMNRAR